MQWEYLITVPGNNDRSGTLWKMQNGGKYDEPTWQDTVVEFILPVEKFSDGVSRIFLHTDRMENFQRPFAHRALIHIFF